MVQASEGKWRVLRIPLRYYSNADSLSRTRMIMTVVIVLLSMGLLISGVFSGSPGGISQSHQGLTCLDCHKNNAIMRDDALGAGIETRLGDAPWNHKADRNCQTCHPVVTKDEFIANGDANSDQTRIPILRHTFNEDAGQVQRCSNCHREHRGQAISIIPQVDDHCVQCHQDLTSCRASVAVANRQNIITGFDKNHPDFQLTNAVDPGTVRFSHAVHLNPDLIGEDLTCDSCHQPDYETVQMQFDGRPYPRRGLDGQYHYRKMPTYEENCKSCHGLTLQPGSQISLAHKLSPQEMMEQYLSLLNRELANEPQNRPANQTWVPGATPIDAWRAYPDNAKQSSPERAERQALARALQHIRRQCRHCHDSDHRPPSDPWAQIDSSSFPGIARMADSFGHSTVFNRVWFAAAKFNHAVHDTHMQCIDCHFGIVEGDERPVNLSGNRMDVLIAGQSACLRCHQSQAQPSWTDRVAPNNCTACHAYHTGGYGKSLSGLVEPHP